MRDLSHNPPLRRAFELAGKAANQEGRPMAVLDLTGGGLYAIRAWHEPLEELYAVVLVAKVMPEVTP